MVRQAGISRVVEFIGTIYWHLTEAPEFICIDVNINSVENIFEYLS